MHFMTLEEELEYVKAELSIAIDGAETDLAALEELLGADVHTPNKEIRPAIEITDRLRNQGDRVEQIDIRICRLLKKLRNKDAS